MSDLEKQPNNRGAQEDNAEELRELRELYGDVVGREKADLRGDWEEAGTLGATLRGLLLEGILRNNMTVEEVLDILKRRQHELMEEIRDIVRAKDKIDPENKL